MSEHDNIPTRLSVMLMLLDEIRELNRNLKAFRPKADRLQVEARLVNPKEFASMLKTSPRELRRMKSKGLLPPNVGTDRRPKWRHADVVAHIQGKAKK